MIYTFEHTLTGETKEISMPMADYELYRGEDGRDENWARIYDVPQVNIGNSIAKSIDPWDGESFAKRTGEMKGTVGDLETHSKEMSDKRAAQNGGIDPVKKKYLKDYSKARNGAKHPSEMGKKIEKNGVSVEF